LLDLHEINSSPGFASIFSLLICNAVHRPQDLSNLLQIYTNDFSAAHFLGLCLKLKLILILRKCQIWGF
jgi:hypothetical protein